MSHILAVRPLLAGLMKVCIGNRERMIVNNASAQAYGDSMQPAPDVKMAPMESGHA